MKRHGPGNIVAIAGLVFLIFTHGIEQKTSVARFPIDESLPAENIARQVSRKGRKRFRIAPVGKAKLFQRANDLCFVNEHLGPRELSGKLTYVCDERVVMVFFHAIGVFFHGGKFIRAITRGLLIKAGIDQLLNKIIANNEMLYDPAARDEKFKVIPPIQKRIVVQTPVVLPCADEAKKVI